MISDAVASGPHDEIAECAKHLDLDIARVRRLAPSDRSKAGAYLLETSRGTLVLKQPKVAESPARVGLRRVLGSPAFEWQLAVTRALDACRIERFRYPKIARTDGSSYGLFEFVTGEHLLAMDGVERSRLVEALLEFHFIDLPLSRRGLASRLFALHSRQDVTVARRVARLASSTLGWRLAFRCLRVVAWSRFRQPRLPRAVLMHNDVHPHNVLSGSDGHLYFLDFESVTRETRWALIDIVHYAMPIDGFEVDTDVIHLYLDRFRRLRPDWRLHVGAQLRMALLKRVLDALDANASKPGAGQSYLGFLTDIVTNDRAFEAWLARHGFAAGSSEDPSA